MVFPSFESGMSASDNFDLLFAQGDSKWKLLKELYEKNYPPRRESPFGVKGIPKIIHFIWLGGQFPAEYEKFLESFKFRNPSFKVKLWTDVEAEKFPLKNREVFKSSPNYGTKSDLLRYEILYSEGGLYVDTDFVALQDLSDFNDAYDFFTGISYDREATFFNGLIASVPGHPILKACIDNLEGSQEIHFEKILEKSGPVYFADCFFRVVRNYEKRIVAFPTNFFYPFPAKLRDDATLELVGKHLKPYSKCVHLWHTSWQRRFLEEQG